MMDAQQIGKALDTILHGSRARLFGSPEWARDEDPELYDAIVTLRDSIVKACIHRDGDDGEAFSIGSSYVRHLTSWLTYESEFQVFLRTHNEDEVRALELVKSRVVALIGWTGS